MGMPKLDAARQSRSRRSCPEHAARSTRRAGPTATRRRSTTSRGPSTSSSSRSSARRASTTTLRVVHSGGELELALPGPDGNGPTTWAQESLTRTNTDVSAHWTSKLFDRHWQIEALAGLHNEYFYDRSPNAALNNLNQLQYSGSEPRHARGPARLRGRGERLRALPRQPVLLHGRLRSDHEVHRQPLDGRAQVDAPVRGGRPPRAQVRLAPRPRRPSTSTATTRAPARAARARLVPARRRRSTRRTSSACKTGRVPVGRGRRPSRTRTSSTRPRAATSRPRSTRPSRASRTRSSCRTATARRACAT